MKKIVQILPIGIAFALSIAAAILIETKIVPPEHAGAGVFGFVILVLVWFGVYFVMLLVNFVSIFVSIFQEEWFSDTTMLWVPSVIVSIIALLTILALAG